MAASIHEAIVSALHEGNYEDIAMIIHDLYVERGEGGSLEKFIRKDFANHILNIRQVLLGSPPRDEKIRRIDAFLVQLYKAPVLGAIISYIAHIVYSYS
jgi:hypothetical protein